jgi:tRNA C32,U32 (ribose-2'-O)-methylase TrmJ
MPHIQIVLVEPLYEGNVGFTARVMKNFGFTDLILINPCTIGNEGKARASHADDVLMQARIMTLDEVCASSHRIVATTGTLSHSACHPIRMPYYSQRNFTVLLRNVMEPSLFYLAAKIGAYLMKNCNGQISSARYQRLLFIQSLIFLMRWG